MRRRPSVSSASTNTSPTLSASSPFLTPPTSCTPSRGSDQTQNSKRVDNNIKKKTKKKRDHRDQNVNNTKVLPLPPPPVHPESKRNKTRSLHTLPLPPPPLPPKSQTKSRSKPWTSEEDDVLPALPESHTSPPSSFSRSSAYSKDSMEKALLPKRPSASAQSKSKSAGKAIKGERRVGGAGSGPTAAIYVNELGPKGSWYFPVGTAPRRTTTKKETKGMDSEPGFIKTWYRAFRRRVSTDA